MRLTAIGKPARENIADMAEWPHLPAKGLAWMDKPSDGPRFNIYVRRRTNTAASALTLAAAILGVLDTRGSVLPGGARSRCHEGRDGGHEMPAAGRGFAGRLGNIPVQCQLRALRDRRERRQGRYALQRVLSDPLCVLSCSRTLACADLSPDCSCVLFHFADSSSHLAQDRLPVRHIVQDARPLKRCAGVATGLDTKPSVVRSSWSRSSFRCALSHALWRCSEDDG